MLEETARVIRVDKDTVVLETESRSSCSQCSSSGCSTSVLAKLFNVKSNQFELKNDSAANTFQPGQQVGIAINDITLVKAALYTYILPLLIMLGSALIAQSLGASEITQAIIGLIGLGLGFMVLKIFSQHHQDRFKPRLIPNLEPHPSSRQHSDK